MIKSILKSVLLSALLLVGYSSFAQEQDEEEEQELDDLQLDDIVGGLALEASNDNDKLAIGDLVEQLVSRLRAKNLSLEAIKEKLAQLTLADLHALAKSLIPESLAVNNLANDKATLVKKLAEAIKTIA